MTSTPSDSSTGPLPDRPGLPGGRIVWIISTIVILAAAFWLRFWKLGDLPGVNGDEARDGVQALRFLAGDHMNWRTPTGNLMNAFHFGSLVILHAFWSPSFALLRSVPVVSGLAALLANFWCCHRTYDWPTMVTSTLLFAVLPISIAYSRFAWDTCHTLLVTLLALHAALMVVRRPAERKRWTVWSLVALGACVWVHPVNVFLTPICAACFLYAWQGKSLRPWTTLIAPRMQHLVLATSYVLMMTAAWILGGILGQAMMGGRHVSLDDAWSFGLNFLRLFSGTTTYRYISGSFSAVALDLSDGIALALMLLAAVGFFKRWQAEHDIGDRCLLFGWLTATLLLYLIVGPAALQPHFERYGMWLIAPTGLLLARGAGWWLYHPEEFTGRLGRAGFIAICGLLLWSFHINYFQFVEKTGGASHRAFRTAFIEPKQQVWQFIRQASQPFRDQGRTVLIIADDWWSYWPLAYLAGGQRGVQVLFREAPDQTGKAVLHEVNAGKKIIAAAGNQAATWQVDFVTDRKPEDPSQSKNPISSAPTHLFLDYAGRPVFQVTGPA